MEESSGMNLIPSTIFFMALMSYGVTEPHFTLA